MRVLMKGMLLDWEEKKCLVKERKIIKIKL